MTIAILRVGTPLLAGIAVLASGISPLSPVGAQTSWVKPVDSRPSAGYFDRSYVQSQDRQHLGVDLPMPSGTSVKSPVSGIVITNATDHHDIMQAYLVIRDSATNQEHILGHISSDLKRGSKVSEGQTVGFVRDWGRNSHVHWGVNSRSIAAAMGFSNEGEWGWGRAPTAVTTQQAASRGWMDAWNAGVRLSSAPSRPALSPVEPSPRSAVPAGIPSTPLNTLPGRSSEPGARLPGPRVAITWSSVSGATEYDLSVRDLTDKKSLSIDRLSRTYHSVRVKSGNTYRWSVKACNQAGCSEASDRLYFTAQ